MMTVLAILLVTAAIAIIAWKFGAMLADDPGLIRGILVILVMVGGFWGLGYLNHWWGAWFAT